jgi:hypothetical protein
VKAVLQRTIKTGDNKYDAMIILEIEGKKLYVNIPGLVRKPINVKISEVEGLIRIELINEKEEGYACCYISPKIVEEGFTTIKCPVGRAWIVTAEVLKKHGVETSENH